MFIFKFLFPFSFFFLFLDGFIIDQKNLVNEDGKRLNIGHNFYQKKRTINITFFV